MPRNKQNTRPTEFLSDVEEDVEVPQQGTETPSPHRAKEARVEPSGSQTPPAENFFVKGVDPPAYNGSRGGSPTNLVELVQVLTKANASLKGRIDDTGRFELKFGFNRGDKHHRERPNDKYLSSGSSTGGSPPARKLLWK